MKNEPLSGVIPWNEDYLTFSTQRDMFEFVFMTNNIYSVAGRNEVVDILPNDGFIYGKTHSGSDIAIWAGKSPVVVLGSGKLNTSAYIKSKGNLGDHPLEWFDGIRFKGGVLKKVFHIKGVEVERSDGSIIVSHNNDELGYEIKTKDYEFAMCIWSKLKESRGLEGLTIDNSEVILEIRFNESQPLKDLFKHYNIMKNFLSFLVFRDDVDFDDIVLMKEREGTDYMDEYADVFIKEDIEQTKKNNYHCICLEDLCDTIPELLRLFYDTEEKQPTVMLGFLPSNDADLYKMNNTKLRAVCTAIESELSFIDDINSEKNDLLAKLVDEVKKTIRQFRKDNDGLSNNTYNYISSNIKTWSFPLAEKICALCKEYQEEMTTLNNFNIEVTEETIRELVKYRNDITHGSHRTPDLKIAVTAQCLGGLVYCCILKRVGLQRDKILELCKNKILK